MKIKRPSKVELECLNNIAINLGIRTKYSVRNIISNLSKSKHRRNGERIEITPTQRRRILNRDKHRCVLCSCKYNLCIHHRKRVADGGTDEDDNLVTLCYLCHAKQHPGLSSLILNQWYDILLEEIHREYFK